MKRFEYRTEKDIKAVELKDAITGNTYYDIEPSPVDLSRMGAEGWELCGFINGHTFIFKREL